MRWAPAFAILALFPAGLNHAAWGGTPMIVALCSDRGPLHAVVLGERLPAGHDGGQRPDCAKGCHGAAPRKRSFASEA